MSNYTTSWRFELADKITPWLLWAIGKLNPWKDRWLAYELRKMAMDYDTRPDDADERDRP